MIISTMWDINVGRVEINRKLSLSTKTYSTRSKVQKHANSTGQVINFLQNKPNLENL